MYQNTDASARAESSRSLPRSSSPPASPTVSANRVEPTPLSPPATDEELRRLVEPHMGLLRGVALRILGCPDQAQDAVQDAILAFWNARTAAPEIRGWLVRTVVHRSLHRRRTERRRRRWEDLAGADHWSTCPICDPEDEVSRRQLLEAVDRAAQRLSDEHQIVLALRAEGLEYEEIAHRLSLPVGTVRSRLNRARRALRERLPGEGV